VGTFLVRRSGALALAAVFCIAVPGRTAPQGTVDELVAKNLAAKGGLARLKAVETIKQTATMTMMGTSVPMTIYTKRPNMVRQEMTVDKKTIINSFDGQTPWIINPLTGSTLPMLVSGPQAAMIKEQSSFDGPLVDFKDRGITVSVEGLELAGDRVLIHLLVTSKTKQVRHLYLDSTTFLDVKMMTEQDKFKLEQEFDDYRDVDGIQWPFRTRTSTNGVLQSEIKVEKVEFNVKMDDALFRVPKGS
jgi:outer membrane lipoprotein-sorting protein